MKYAMYDNRLYKPTKGIDALCPKCRQPVIAKMGAKTEHHWSHFPESPDCDFKHSPDSYQALLYAMMPDANYKEASVIYGDYAISFVEPHSKVTGKIDVLVDGSDPYYFCTKFSEDLFETLDAQVDELLATADITSESFLELMRSQPELRARLPEEKLVLKLLSEEPDLRQEEEAEPRVITREQRKAYNESGYEGSLYDFLRDR